MDLWSCLLTPFIWGHTDSGARTIGIPCKFTTNMHAWLLVFEDSSFVLQNASYFRRNSDLVVSTKVDPILEAVMIMYCILHTTLQQLYAVTVSWSTVYSAHWMSVLCSSLSRRSTPNIPSALCRYVVCWSTMSMSPARWWTHGECIRQCLCTSLAVENVVLWNVRRWQKATRLIYG